MTGNINISIFGILTKYFISEEDEISWNDKKKPTEKHK